MYSVKRYHAGILIVLGVLLHDVASSAQVSSDPVPHQAAEVGYIHQTFASRFRLNEVDLKNTARSEYSWFLRGFFGKPPTNPNALTFLNGGGLKIDGGIIYSAALGGSANRWTGIAFGGGGYFEAELKFNPDDMLSSNTTPASVNAPSWPAFWSMSIEHFAHLNGEYWPNQLAGYVHFIEVDIFEFNPKWWRPAKCCYAGTVHEWFGVYQKTCKKGFCGVSNNPGGGSRFGNYKISYPADFDFRKFHKYGVLWVPATTTSDGYLQYYLDGKQASGKISWTEYTNQAPSPSGITPWTFGILDKQHLVLSVGSGIEKPLEVRSINVWQRTGDNNWTH